jgi:hypothetical protein
MWMARRSSVLWPEKPTYIHTYIHTYTHICRYTYMHTYIHLQPIPSKTINAYLRILVFLYVQLCFIWFECIVCVYVFMYVCMYVCMPEEALCDTYLFGYIHIYIHTCVRMFLLKCFRMLADFGDGHSLPSG